MSGEPAAEPVVNDAFGTDLPPLVSSQALVLHSATFEQFPGAITMLQDNLEQA